MPKYRVRQGAKHWVRNEKSEVSRVPPGTIMELRKDQYESFKESFEPVVDSTPAPAPRMVNRGDDTYDIIHPETNKPINDTPLTQAQAEEALKAYNA